MHMKKYVTSYLDIEIKNSFTDEYGVIYSHDGKRLLKGRELEDYVIREGTEIICDRAFQSMSFSKITLPQSLKALGVCCFANNKLLKDINFPSGIEYLATNNPFGGCKSLKHINIESNKFIIDNNLLYSSDFQVLYCALHNFQDGSIVEIDNRTKEISANCFWSHKELSKVVIPTNVTKIGKAAFKYCAIKVIEIKGNLEVIPEEFAESASGDRIELPENVKTIEKRAFQSSTFERLIMGSSIEEIGESAFAYAGGLYSLCLNNIKRIGESAFQNCFRLESLIINGTIDEIPPKAFNGCDSLTYVELGESISKIKDNAFVNNTQLEKVFIKGRVHNIDVGNFMFCDSLSEICVTKENYFPVLSAIIKFNPRLEGYVYDGFYNTKEEDPLYTASIELVKAHIKSNTLNGKERFEYVKPFLLRFAKEKRIHKWFSRVTPRDYCVTGHAAFLNSIFINRDKAQSILNTCICSLNDLGLGYFFYSDEMRRHECSVLIIQVLVENWEFLTDMSIECLEYLKIENTYVNQMLFWAYIIEFLFSRCISVDENKEIRFKHDSNPTIESKRILYKRGLFLKELLAICPDFFNRNDYTEKFSLFYPTLMQIVRKRAFAISREDFVDIIDEENSYIKKIYWDENNYEIE